MHRKQLCIGAFLFVRSCMKLIRSQRIPPKRQYALFYEAEYTCYEEGAIEPEGFYNEPIEIALKVIDLNTNRAIHYFETMVKPKAFPELSTFCRSLTRIKQQEVDKGITFEELIETLTDIYAKYEPYVITWSHRDKEFLMKACAEANLHFPLGPFSTHLDMANEFKIYSRLAKHITLRESCQLMGLRDSLAHRAGDELFKLVRLFEIMRKQRWNPVSKSIKLS